MAHIELHVHPFLGSNTISDVVQAMEERQLDVLAMESLDCSLFQHVAERTKGYFPTSVCDNSGIRLPNGRYFLNAREYNTKENLHILTVGYSLDDATPHTEIREIIDKGLANGALILLDHPFVDNGKTRTAGHISEELGQELESICKEYSGQVTLEWNSYCVPWIRQGLRQGLNAVGLDIRYHDVNKKVEEFSESLKKQGYNVPIIADTDLHARTRRHLQHMGTARIITNVQGETPGQIVASMRRNIFKGEYENVKRYVSSLHLLEAFCVPILLPRYFKKPRS